MFEAKHSGLVLTEVKAAIDQQLLRIPVPDFVHQANSPFVNLVHDSFSNAVSEA